MDASSGDRPSPRSRQLLGPRPPRLAVSKDSHKVRKPPVAPQRHHHLQQQVQDVQQQHHHHQQYQQQARQPVIIYDASPKVIHTKPGDFMALVQRLIGPGSTSQVQFDAAAAGPSSSDAPPQPASFAMELEPREFLLSPTAAFSPATRLAAIERSMRPPRRPPPPHAPALSPAARLAAIERSMRPPRRPPPPHAPAPAPPYYYDDLFLPAPAFRPGILSPAALPPAASTGLFSPMPFDPSCLSWLSELSPFLPSAGTRAEQAPPFAPSPRSSLLATPTMPSPATVSVLEFFSTNFPDL